MQILGVTGLKGGVGKSTIALNLACALRAEGKRVLLVDVDPQATCRSWAERAAERGLDGPPVVQLSGKTLRRDLPAVAAGMDVVVLDSPPRLGAETKAILMVADLVLLPVTPGGADVWALEETIHLVAEAQVLRPELRAAVVHNRADRTVLARHAAIAVGELAIPVLDARLGHRVAFGAATIAGLGVVDFERDSEAAVEVRRLTRETMRLVEMGAAA
ncbi:MAG TPA: ParA family partition ATPase [Polyangiaceae bacterium]|jgi:chromosome partitioning protein